VVAILPVRDEMDAIGMEGLSDRVTMARDAGADAVVLAFDTPGGEMLSTLELCRRINVEQPTMAHTLDRMERDELIKRKPAPEDKRRALIHLTPRAQD
jgi:hypothetical protein